MVSRSDYDIDRATAWCPGCGNFAILNALKRALPEAGLAPHEVALITGIGQAPKTFDYMHICGFNGLHGRPLPVATGFKLANHGMKVIVGHGDGDAYGEGGNHFLHATRRNIGLLDMVHNNQVYALTKGQFSPTTQMGRVTPTSPQGSNERPMNALALALSQRATFVARSCTADPRHLIRMIVGRPAASRLCAARDHAGLRDVSTAPWTTTFIASGSMIWRPRATTPPTGMRP